MGGARDFTGHGLRDGHCGGREKRHEPDVGTNSFDDAAEISRAAEIEVKVTIQKSEKKPREKNLTLAQKKSGFWLLNSGFCFPSMRPAAVADECAEEHAHDGDEQPRAALEQFDDAPTDEEGEQRERQDDQSKFHRV